AVRGPARSKKRQDPALSRILEPDDHSRGLRRAWLVDVEDLGKRQRAAFVNPLVLVTGGTGKTGRRLVSRLGEAGVSCRTAVRGVSSNPFDWTQPSTWARTLEGVTAAYLVAPAGDGDPAAMMIRFAEFAIERGVSRFVLLSASLLPDGGPAMGQVHKWLRQNAAEWTALRPS